MAKKAEKRRNPKGEGNLRYRKNGTFEYRICYIDIDGEKKRKSFYGQNDTICFDKANKFLQILEKKKSGIDIDATIVDIAKEKIQSDLDKNFVHEQGYARNLDTLSILEKSNIGNIPITELKEVQIDLFLRSITHYSNSTIVKIYRQLRIAYRIALNKGIITSNIMENCDLKCPKSKIPDKKVYALTKSEQKILVEYLNNYKSPEGRNSYVSQIMISLLSGLRMGEVNALKPENIDFNQNVIHVRSTVSRGENFRSFIKEGTKTYAGIRDVPIMDTLKPILEDAIKNQKENPYNLLFYDNINNKIITTNQVNCFFKRACEKCNIAARGQHALRHTFATRCIEADVPAVVLKNWLGHTDIHITLDTYADVFSCMHNNSMAKLSDYINNISN